MASDEQCINYLKAYSRSYGRNEITGSILKCIRCEGNKECPNYMTDSMKPDIIDVSDNRILNEISGDRTLDERLLEDLPSNSVDYRSIGEAVNEGEVIFDYAGDYTGKSEIYVDENSLKFIDNE